MEVPRFPQFLPLGLEHREIVQKILWDYQPTTSELTFSNLFIWQAHYGLSWSLYQDWLVMLSDSPHGTPFFLPPVGPTARGEVCRHLLQWLGEVKGVANPSIDRADACLAGEVASLSGLHCEPVRDHFDYVYRSADLISLAGNKYHGKRNHINSLKRSYSYVYEPLREEFLGACLNLADRWCEFKRCAEDLNLTGEWEAIRLAIRHFRELSLQGGAILVKGKVEAFSLGEMLNHRTAVIHIEKANPEIRELYTLINQQFCEHAWKEVGIDQPGTGPGRRRSPEGKNVLPARTPGREIPHYHDLREVFSPGIVRIVVPARQEYQEKLKETGFRGTGCQVLLANKPWVKHG